MKNKASRIILTVAFVGILIFGASFARAQTSNEEMVKMLQSLIQMLTQMVAQLQAQLAQKVTTTTTTTIAKAGACSWCGGYCVHKTPNMLCADIAPPEGYRCVEGPNGQCEKVPFVTNTTCTDSDSGQNYYVQGTVTQTYYDAQGIVTQRGTYTDSCIDTNTLGEHYCVNTNNGSIDQTIHFICPSGYSCQNGACKTSPSTPYIIIYSNPQADNNGNVIIKQGDRITITGIPSNLSGQMGVDYTRAFFFDSIFNNSCTNTDWVITCTAKQLGTSNFYIRAYKGNQTYESNIIKVVVIANQTTTCTDSDGGDNIHVAGSVTGNYYPTLRSEVLGHGTGVGLTKTFTDYCESSTTLKEFYCVSPNVSTALSSGNEIVDVSYSCPSGYICQNGACKTTVATTIPSYGRCTDGSACGWCGNQCTKVTNGMSCADVMPPQGATCACVNNTCTVQYSTTLMDALNKLSASLVSLMELLKR